VQTSEQARNGRTKTRSELHAYATKQWDDVLQFVALSTDQTIKAISDDTKVKRVSLWL
jgi:hypothetical protein